MIMVTRRDVWRQESWPNRRGFPIRSFSFTNRSTISSETRSPISANQRSAGYPGRTQVQSPLSSSTSSVPRLRSSRSFEANGAIVIAPQNSRRISKTRKSS